MKKIKFLIFALLVISNISLLTSCDLLFGDWPDVDASDFAAERALRGDLFIQIPYELKDNGYELIKRYLHATYDHNLSSSLKKLDDIGKVVEKNEYKNTKFSNFIDETKVILKLKLYIDIAKKPNITKVKYTLTFFDQEKKELVKYEYTFNIEDKPVNGTETMEFEFKEVGGSKKIKAWCFYKIHYYI